MNSETDATNNISARETISISKLQAFTLSIITLLLVTASVLKIALLIQNPFADIKTGVSIFWLWSGAIVELGVVSIIVQRGYCLSFKLATCIALHTVFLIVSSCRYFWGFESCGCAGDLEIHPSVAIALNIVILTLLFASWRKRPVDNPLRLQAVSTSVGLLAAAVFFAIINIPSKDTIVVAQVVVEDLVTNRPTETIVVLKNLTATPVEVVGQQFSCSCIIAKRERRIIAPHSNETFRFVLTPQRPGYFWQRAYYLLDSEQQPKVAVDFVGFSIGDLK